MTEYKRWISYVYSYENNTKQNNVGYIKVEVRGAKTKVSVNIKVLSVTEPMPVYMYVRDSGVMRGIKIGTINMDKGTGQANYELDTELVEGGTMVSDTGGVIIYHSDDKFFGSEWDDIDISIQDFRTDVGNQYAGNSEDGNLEGSNSEGGNSESSNSEGGHSEDGNSEVGNLDAGNSELAAVETSEHVSNGSGQSTSSEDAAEFVATSIVAEPEEEVRMEYSEDNLRKKIEEAASKMLETYPRMFPFENDEMVKCVRIEPQDIGQLPIDTWALANNSFLLHGFYSYRHLILMCTMDDIRPAYLIGVPGIYHNRDEYMAQMFGFGLFKPMKNCKNVQGEFGYWCVSITNM